MYPNLSSFRICCSRFLNSTKNSFLRQKEFICSIDPTKVGRFIIQPQVMSLLCKFWTLISIFTDHDYLHHSATALMKSSRCAGKWSLTQKNQTMRGRQLLRWQPGRILYSHMRLWIMTLPSTLVSEPHWFSMKWKMPILSTMKSTCHSAKPLYCDQSEHSNLARVSIRIRKRMWKQFLNRSCISKL